MYMYIHIVAAHVVVEYIFADDIAIIFSNVKNPS